MMDIQIEGSDGISVLKAMRITGVVISGKGSLHELHGPATLRTQLQRSGCLDLRAGIFWGSRSLRLSESSTGIHHKGRVQ